MCINTVYTRFIVLQLIVMKYYFLSLILVLFTIFIPNKGFAQFNQYSQDIDVSFVPANPGPNTKVYASLESYSVDLNSSTIVWSINGKVVKDSTGGKDLSFTTGNTGTVTQVTIKTTDSLGQTIVKNFNILPSSVDIIWQSDSSVPPFYKGKAMFSHQNNISFIAVPHITYSGKEISASNLVYTWKRNGSVVEDASGYGKNVYSFTGSLISRPLDIEVEVYSPNTNSTASGNTKVSPIDPLVIFYKKSPLYGIELQRNIYSSEQMLEPEITVVAVPLFFGVKQYNDRSLVYKWSINGKLTGDDTSQNTQVFRPAEGVSGSSQISISIENTKKILQLAKNSFNLSFDNTNTQ